MKKRVLILACALALLVGCIAVTSLAATTKTGMCQACGESVTWEPIVYGGVAIPDGETTVHKHYYVTEDTTSASQIVATAGASVCIDLCGKDLAFPSGRAFLAYQAAETAPAAISIQDSVGGATVTSYSATQNDTYGNTNNIVGGIMWVDNYCTINIYGGTYSLDIKTPDNLRTTTGAVAAIYPGGTLNIYDGTLNGSTATTRGGNIDLQQGGALNVYGGVITNGVSPTGSCVNVRASGCSVTLAGDAQVDEIYYHYNDTASLTVSGAFTGSANLAYNTTNVTNLAIGTAIGTLINNGSIADADLYCTNGDGFGVAASGTTLQLAEAPEEEVRYTCPHCNQIVKWEVFTTTAPSAAGTYHYYLDKNYTSTSSPVSKQYGPKGGAQVCLDLNGHSYTTDGRAISTSGTGTVLSIMDTAGNGCITGTSGSNNPGGGTISVGSSTTVNIYSGTLKFERDDKTSFGTGRGGVIQASGTLNVYGGKIVGGDMVDSTYESFNTVDGVGGAIYASTTLNILGGEITSGTVPASGAGPCVYVANSSAKVTLGGNAKVEDIYFISNVSTRFTVNSDFTGTATLSYAPELVLHQGLVVGVCDATDWQGSITTSSEAFPTALPVEGALVLSAYPVGTVAATNGQGYTSLQEAIDAAKDGKLVEMLKSVDGNLTVPKNLCLQLNGCSITGTVTVSSGKTLYVMDSATDDYTVSDGKYGKLTKVVGKVAGVSVDNGVSNHSYIAVKETDGTSFHCVALQIYAMSLRVTDVDNEPGLYYKSHFLADEKAAPLLTSHGVALSVRETPNAQNMDSKCKYTAFAGFESGPYGNLGNSSSTLLKGIMKTDNSAMINGRNISILVYGRAYAKTSDGQYIFGKAVSRSLADQLVGVDAMVDSLSNTQLKAVTELYHQFKSVLEKRALTNIAEAYESKETGTLKVLVLGNSHGLDATNLLYEVFHAEREAGNHTQDVLIAALYYSGCRVDQHHAYLKGNQKVYTYHKNDGSQENRTWVVKEATCLDALRDEQWDVILMQQMNTNAGREDNYKAADWKYVADYLLNNQDDAPILGFHMTWANPDDYELYLNDDAPYKISTGATGVTNWRNNHQNRFPDPVTGLYEQDVMYAEIMRLTQKYLVDSTDWLGKDYFDERYIMNSATAVHYAQNVCGRTHEEIYRDYTHMNDYGRLICAYQWYAQLMGLSEITEVNMDEIPAVLKHKNSKFPAAVDGVYAVTEDMKADLIASVNWTLENPFSLPEQ